MNADRYRVSPGTRVDLDARDPAETDPFKGGKQKGLDAVSQLSRRLETLQEVLYAEGKHAVLVVLQAMDTGGKDGVIRRVFEGINPLGVRVATFKVPTPEELAHDYLWRAHQQTPRKGQITIFNRSHYEDVLVVRVRQLVPPDVWRRRYAHINAFEKTLADEGTIIVKFFLHISKEEQRARLQARLDDSTKQWKFAVGDLAERARWNRYQVAYETALSRTSTDWAPWYIIPADRKWYRDLVVGQVLVDTLEALNMSYPPPKDDLTGIKVV